MTVQFLPSGILIHCSLAFLRKAGLCASSLDREAALALAKTALAPTRRTLPAYPELQLFLSEKELLIFVRPFLPEKSHFSMNCCALS